ncbi:MAG: ABC transporter permease [Deltaproteobacteria bacterium]|nr:ABC transporter permease [Deltaproteobacteria bacterium]
MIALVLRETRTRFGRNRLGYLWALIEPIVITFTFYGVLVLAGRGHPPAGMSLFAFIATGVLPYTLFSNTIMRVADAINSNKALLYYPQVRPIELVISRAALEAATFIAVFVLMMSAEALISQRLELEDPLLVIGGLLAASALGTGLGLVFCALGQVSTLADRVRGPLMRPLFWISGIFFTVGSLPDNAREAVLWNPMMHVTELVRAGWFPGHDANYFDLGYVLWWIGGLTLVGLILERWVRRRIDLT